MIYVHKIVPAFFLPLGVTLVLVFLGLAFRRRSLIWTGTALLWISSTPLVSGCLVQAVEGNAERIRAVDAQEVDAIVILSAGRVVAPGPAAISEWGDPDRFFGGVELFKAGKAPLLVVTGGWSPSTPNDPLEGEVLKRFATSLGVPPGRIVSTGRVVNTADEATAVATLLLPRQATRPRVLLVTSAFHMPRARQLFERAGLSVVPFPVDFRAPQTRAFDVLRLLPSAAALDQMQMALREIYGRLYYRVVGP